MTSEKESRKTVIHKEIRSVKNTITGIEKERVVLGKALSMHVYKIYTSGKGLSEIFWSGNDM